MPVKVVQATFTKPWVTVQFNVRISIIMDMDREAILVM